MEGYHPKGPDTSEGLEPPKINKNIQEALKEVQDIKSGKVEATTWEDFKKELDIDKDIEIVKQIKEHYILEQQNGVVPEYAQAIENVLSELEKKDKQIALEIEGRNLLVHHNENLKSELETYKKIAEKLAEEYKKENVHYDNTGIIYCELHYENDYTKHGKCSKHNNGANCKQCIIDWARKEVEKDGNNSSGSN